MSQMKISEQAFLLAWHNQKLVRDALKYVHVSRTYQGYEDLFQEGIITYAGMIELHGKLTRELNRLSFRKVVWHTIDLLRKEKRNQNLEHVLKLLITNRQFSSAELNLVLAQELPKLNNTEKMLFYSHLINGQSITSIAQKNQINRVQLQRVKRQLLVHLRKILILDYDL
ncbi:sigma-70 family RNA polymerase sigma factor [Lactobacillus bombicola]|jgi:DNA-directed RNA polymerase specialized sigma subunit|nr:sigma-70 family RNA polymerase sigma factor [Lactobacillus bombicola]